MTILFKAKLLKQFSFEEDRQFVGIENNLLLYRKALDGAFIYQAYDIKDQLVFEVPYDDEIASLVQLSTDFYMYYNGDYFGFIDGKGKEKKYNYQPRFLIFSELQYYQSFYKDYYPIQLEREDKMGLINRKGETILAFEYSKVSEVVEDLVFCIPITPSVIPSSKRYARRSGQVRDLNGNLLTDHIFLGESGDLENDYELLLRKPLGFYEGLLVNKESAIERIDTLENGELQYWASQKDFYYYIDQDRKMKIALDTSIIFAGLFSEGLAPVVISKKGLGFINKKGEVVIDGAYEISSIPSDILPFLIIPEFKGGYAFIRSHNCYINNKGKAFFSYTEKYDMDGHWMEVRSEEVGIDIGIPMPSLEFVFEKSGVVKLKEYGNPNGRFISGHYMLQDSILSLNPEAEGKFRRFLMRDKFIIEKRNEKELILKTVLRPHRRHYFLAKNYFDQLSSDEIRKNYTYTASDTLKMIERKKKQAALKELRKNDRSIPEFPGGYDAMIKFIADNLVYPANHSREKLVQIKFEVDVDGKLLNIRARANNLEDPYVKEAERLVRTMPNWLPYRYNNIPRKYNYYVNIRFKRSK